MKAAERQIDMYEFALKIYNKVREAEEDPSADRNDQEEFLCEDLYELEKLATSNSRTYVQMRVLLLSARSIWHPLMNECPCENPLKLRLGGDSFYREAIVNISIRSMVPMHYSCSLVKVAGSSSRPREMPEQQSEE